MTNEQKKELRKKVDEIADSMFDAMLQSYEMVEKDMPAELTIEQKQSIFTAIFNTCFNTQTQLLQKTITETKQKVQDRDAVLQMSREIHNARNKAQ